MAWTPRRRRNWPSGDGLARTTRPSQETWGIRLSIGFDKGDEDASIGITVSPEQVPQYFGLPPDMASTVPARR